MRKISKLAAILLAFHMLMLSGFYQSVSAAMISTESIINVDRGQSPRDYLNNLLTREEIQAALISQGIDPQEAQDRIDSLSDDEIGRFVHEMDPLPAGGDGGLGVFTFSLILIIAMLIDLCCHYNENPALCER
ncbi:MAG: PA2779 family protein [Desulfobacterales bacterium]|jgi:hypothetical protein